MTEEHAVSRALAEFAAGLGIDDLSADVVHQATRCLVDWLGCTIAGSATGEGARVRAGISALDAGDGSRTAPIVGTRQRAGASHIRHQRRLLLVKAEHHLAHLDPITLPETHRTTRTTIGSQWPSVHHHRVRRR